MPVQTSEKYDLNTEKQIYEFLSGHDCAVLATSGTDGVPYAAVVYYSVTDDITLRFVTKRGTQKSRNIETNSNVMMVVYDKKTQSSIQISGEAVEINNPKVAHEAFRSCMRASLHSSGSIIPPVARLDAGEFVAYKLRPKEIRMSEFNRKRNKKLDNVFESLSFAPL